MIVLIIAHRVAIIALYTYNVDDHYQLLHHVALASKLNWGVVCNLAVSQRKFCAVFAVWGQSFWPLFGVERLSLLRGYFCISTIVISIRSTTFGRCRESGRFSESRCWEV